MTEACEHRAWIRESRGEVKRCLHCGLRAPHGSPWPNAAPKASEAPVSCRKVPHDNPRGGYMHGEDEDGPYDVDGVLYCGRCHSWFENCERIKAQASSGLPKPAPDPEPKQGIFKCYHCETCRKQCSPKTGQSICCNCKGVLDPEPKQGSACCEECKRYHRHFRTDCCKCRTSFGPSDIPEAEPKQGSEEPQKIRCNLITDPTLKSCEETILALRDDIQTLQGSLAYWRDNRLPAVEAERDALRAEVDRLKAIEPSGLSATAARGIASAHIAAEAEVVKLRAELAAADENLKNMLQAAGEEAERQLAEAREEIAKEKARADKAEGIILLVGLPGWEGRLASARIGILAARARKGESK